MKVVATPEATALVRERGGHVYVWTDRTRCCGGAMTLLQTSLDPPARRHDFREFKDDGDLTVHLDSGRRQPPDELHLEVGGWGHTRIDAFWNGCAYVDEAIGPSSSSRKDV
jgi:hypothetical protein